MNELRIVIVEDEPATARNLIHMLKSLDNDIRVLTTLPSVSGAGQWFSDNIEGCDLIFMDIRLADGISFEIFKHTKISQPVVFVTAYDEYAIQAFKNNGIDYILKPFDEEEIGNALEKFRNLTSMKPVAEQGISTEIIRKLGSLHSAYRRSFLIHHREKLIPLEATKIAWFYTAHEIVYAHTMDEKGFVIEFTMEQLEQQLDPEIFFRANRQFIVNRHAIVEVDFYFNGRLSVKIKPQPNEQVLISKARVPVFKEWMQA